MGLDMYARRKLYVKQWSHQKPEERYTVHVERGGKPIVGFQADRVSSVDEEVMYWRKANHIHAWFVDNVQDGKDDCREYEVDWDKLRELHGVCFDVMSASKLVKGMVHHYETWDKKTDAMVVHRRPGQVIKNPSVAKELLPTKKGFFFGTDEYDEDYLCEIERTLAWTMSMLSEYKSGFPARIYYQSSW